MTRLPNYTQVPNEHLDDMHLYDPSEFRLLLALDRLTFGFHRKAARKSLRALAMLTGMSTSTVQAAAARLEQPTYKRPAVLQRTADNRGVTEWTILLEDSPAQAPVEEKDEKAPRPKDPPNPNLLPLAKAIEQVTGVALADQRSRIFSEAKKLCERYTAEQVLQVFGPGGLWYTADYRGQKGSRPSVSQVRSEISRLLSDKSRAAQVTADKDGFYL
jgi:hypothetical protein